MHHSGDYVCQAVIGNGMQTVKTVSISVIGWQTQFCPLQHLSTERGKKYESFNGDFHSFYSFYIVLHKIMWFYEAYFKTGFVIGGHTGSYWGNVGECF